MSLNVPILIVPPSAAVFMLPRYSCRPGPLPHEARTAPSDPCKVGIVLRPFSLWSAGSSVLVSTSSVLFTSVAPSITSLRGPRMAKLAGQVACRASSTHGVRRAEACRRRRPLAARTRRNLLKCIPYHARLLVVRAARSFTQAPSTHHKLSNEAKVHEIYA